MPGLSGDGNYRGGEKGNNMSVSSSSERINLLPYIAKGILQM